MQKLQLVRSVFLVKINRIILFSFISLLHRDSSTRIIHLCLLRLISCVHLPGDPLPFLPIHCTFHEGPLSPLHNLLHEGPPPPTHIHCTLHEGSLSPLHNLLHEGPPQFRIHCFFHEGPSPTPPPQSPKSINFHTVYINTIFSDASTCDYSIMKIIMIK